MTYQAGDSRRRLRPFLRSNCPITIACEPVLCDAHLGLHKITWSHKSGVRRCLGSGGWEPGLPSHYDRQPRRQASAGLFSTTPSLLPPVCVLPSVSTAVFCAPYTAPCLGGMGSKDGCTLPNALHGDVRRGLAAQQPTPHSILSLCLEYFFLVQLFCISASRPTPHSCTASGPAVAIESEKGHGALQLARSIGLCAVSR